MHFIDIIILIPLIWFGYKGFNKGFIIEVVSILAFVLGIWGGLHLSDYASEFVQDYVSEKYNPIVSFSVVFIVIVILVFVAGKMIEKLVKEMQLGIVNKIAGAFFGAGKIVLILSFLLLIIDKYDQSFHFIPEELEEESILYAPLQDVTKIVIPALENSETFREQKFEINLPDFKNLKDSIP